MSQEESVSLLNLTVNCKQKKKIQHRPKCVEVRHVDIRNSESVTNKTQCHSYVNTYELVSDGGLYNTSFGYLNNNSVEAQKSSDSELAVPRWLENHFCKSCAGLMNSECRSPTILEPCGHTVCIGCSGSVMVSSTNTVICSEQHPQYCPVCLCTILQVHRNSALFDVIQRHCKDSCRNSLPQSQQGDYDEEGTVILIRSLTEDKSLPTKENALRIKNSINILDQKSRSLHEILLTDEGSIKKAISNIDLILTRKKTANQQMKALRLQLRNMEQQELQSKARVLLIRSRIQKRTSTLEKVTLSRNTLESRLDKYHLSTS